jgi:hypothetical protein
MAGGFDADDPTRRFIAPEQQSYPFAYERVAQLFDSPNAPDLAVSPRDWCSGSSARHARRAPRAPGARAHCGSAGPGVVVGTHSLAARSIDIAPTCLAALGFPLIAVRRRHRPHQQRAWRRPRRVPRPSGRPSGARGAHGDGPAPHRLYVFLMDGMHQTELEDRLAATRRAPPPAAPARSGGGAHRRVDRQLPVHHLAQPHGHRHRQLGRAPRRGEPQLLPARPGRRCRRRVSRWAPRATPTLRSRASTRRSTACTRAASPPPSTRHSVARPPTPFLEGRNLCDRARVKELTAEFAVDMNPRWPWSTSRSPANRCWTPAAWRRWPSCSVAASSPRRCSCTTNWRSPTAPATSTAPQRRPGDALTETDLRIGRVLALLDERGLFEQTLFVVSADHGMAPQDTALRANPTAHVLAAVGWPPIVAEPMIWLHDVAVEAERAADLRTGRVIVAHNDVDSSGERPACSGAHVTVFHQPPGAPVHQLAAGVTDHNGRFGFATPSDIASEHLSRPRGRPSPRWPQRDAHQRHLCGDPQRQPSSARSCNG